MLSKETKSSSTFSLLLAVAGDTAGGWTILPSGRTPEAARHKIIDWDYIARHFAGGLQAQPASAPLGSRISLSGAQAKMLISLDGTGRPMLPLGTTPSTWIVKPNIRGFEKVWSSAVNEAILMRTAAHCGLGVAEVFFEPTTRACVVKRFDRTAGPNDTTVRLQQYDFCQLSGTVSGKKYEAEGGPGVLKCATLIKTHSARPAVDLRRFLQWIFFNLYTGNNDSHAKNLSLYHLPGQGLRLTPFYDLMDTRLYPGLSRRFALRVGGEDEPGKITRDHLVAMAAELNLKPRFILGMAAAMHAKLAPALQQAIDEIEPTLDQSGKALAERLQQHVVSVANKNAARFIGAPPS
jgi:serine/threonine-protein kinase HipA